MARPTLFANWPPAFALLLDCGSTGPGRRQPCATFMQRRDRAAHRRPNVPRLPSPWVVGPYLPASASRAGAPVRRCRCVAPMFSSRTDGWFATAAVVHRRCRRSLQRSIAAHSSRSRARRCVYRPGHGTFRGPFLNLSLEPGLVCDKLLWRAVLKEEPRCDLTRVAAAAADSLLKQHLCCARCCSYRLRRS